MVKPTLQLWLIGFLMWILPGLTLASSLQTCLSAYNNGVWQKAIKCFDRIAQNASLEKPLRAKAFLYLAVSQMEGPIQLKLGQKMLCKAVYLHPSITIPKDAAAIKYTADLKKHKQDLACRPPSASCMKGISQHCPNCKGDKIRNEKMCQIKLESLKRELATCLNKLRALQAQCPRQKAKITHPATFSGCKKEILMWKKMVGESCQHKKLEPVPSPKRFKHTTSLTVVGIGAAIAIVGAVVFGVSQGTRGTLQNMDQNQPNKSADEINATYGEAQGQWIAGWALLGTGGATLLTGFGILIAEGVKSDSPTQAPTLQKTMSKSMLLWQSTPLNPTAKK